MSEPHESNDQPKPVDTDPIEPKQPVKAKSSSGIQKALLYIAIGVLVGVLIDQKVADFLPSVLPPLMTVFVSFFLLIIVAIIALPRIINYLAKRYTGQDVDVEQVVGDIQSKANHIADTVASYALAKADPEVRKNIRQDLPGILHYLVFSRLRNSGLRMLVTVFVAIGGLMGTILLYNQNELLSGQNDLLTGQNDLLLKQNEKIDNQILLDEASRRSSLNFLLGNVLDQVNEELKNPENTDRHLSPELIGRIASLSQSFQPYYFMEDSSLTEKPLSPERGNLLLALVNSGLDTSALAAIFEKTIFSSAFLDRAVLDSVHLQRANLFNADLSRANLSGADLRGADLGIADLNRANLSIADLKGADLSFADLNDANLSRADLRGTDIRGANLSRADLRYADLRDANLFSVNLFSANLFSANLSWASLSRADLSGAHLRDADLSGADLRIADLSVADLRGADLSGADLRGADLSGADLSGADLSGADLSGADLSGADLSGIKGINSEMLSSFSIYNIKNLPDSLAKKLKTRIEKKPE
ncbi:pentapeptide repeat-containing protein [Flavilitoribacter nigricans]|nr:pentapeptide repeat-containing protein [Flavilitoribacter nigricans]